MFHGQFHILKTTVQYSAGVAKHHNVIATRFCTEMQRLITVSCLCSLEDNLSHK